MRGLQSPQGGCCRGALKEKSDMILFCFFTILFLFFLSIEDLKSRRVRLLPALIFAGGMFLAHLILKDLPLKELFLRVSAWRIRGVCGPSALPSA